MTLYLFSCACACACDLGVVGFDPAFGQGLLSEPGQCRAGAGVFSVSGE